MAERITYAERDRLFGRPCSTSLYLTCELFGQRVRVHYRLHDRLVNTVVAAHRAIVAAGAGDTYPRRIDSYVCRTIRGKEGRGLRTVADSVFGHLPHSLHAYALAWDMFRTPPGVAPPGGVWTPDLALHPAFVATMESGGFAWGGRWARKDEPHFEWSGPPP